MDTTYVDPSIRVRSNAYDEGGHGVSDLEKARRPEEIVYIDEASTYQGAVRWHETVRHSVKDFVRD